MTDHSNNKKDNFLYPRSRYYGEFQPENVIFNANLQEFAQRVNYICNLETGGKIPPHKAYDEIKELWHNLKRSKKNLGIGKKKNDIEGSSNSE